MITMNHILTRAFTFYRLLLKYFSVNVIIPSYQVSNLMNLQSQALRVKPHKLVLNANFWYDHVLTYYRLYFVIASKVIPDTMHSHTMTANIYDILRQGNLYPGKISPLKFVPVEYYLRYDVGKRVNMIDIIMFVAILFYEKS